jgi:hypothetical protein
VPASKIKNFSICSIQDPTWAGAVTLSTMLASIDLYSGNGRFFSSS